jgi:hypothetical protein
VKLRESEVQGRYFKTAGSSGGLVKLSQRSLNKTLNDTNKTLKLHQSSPLIWFSMKSYGHKKMKSYKLKHNNIRHKHVYISKCV